MAIRITCINKSRGNHADPHHAIENLGWINEQTNESGQAAKRARRESPEDPILAERVRITGAGFS